MKTILLITAIAGILFFAYRKVADYWFAKGLKAAQDKYLNIERGDMVGTATLKNVPTGAGAAIGTIAGIHQEAPHRSPVIGYDLDKAQLQFIEQCKARGETGCTITTSNGNSTYISFYKNAYEK